MKKAGEARTSWMQPPPPPIYGQKHPTIIHKTPEQSEAVEMELLENPRGAEAVPLILEQDQLQHEDEAAIPNDIHGGAKRRSRSSSGEDHKILWQTNRMYFINMYVFLFYSEDQWRRQDFFGGGGAPTT